MVCFVVFGENNTPQLRKFKGGETRSLLMKIDKILPEFVVFEMKLWYNEENYTRYVGILRDWRRKNES